MFVFESLFLEMVYLGFAIIGVIFAWTVAVGRWRMKATAKNMLREGVSNTGSRIVHGMVYDHERGIGVKSTSKHSSAWFKELI